MTARTAPVLVIFALVPSIFFLLSPTSVPAAAVAPDNSTMSRADATSRRVLLSPLGTDASIRPGGWRLAAPTATPAPADVPPKVGRSALRLSGKAEQAGSKGDFALDIPAPGRCRLLGLWVYLDDRANVVSVGLQVADAEGEVLLATVPADWRGWRWVEFDTAAGKAFRPAYEQKGKNGTVDLPVKGVNVAWFAKEAGPTGVVVNGLVAAVDEPAAANSRVTTELIGGGVAEPGWPLGMQVVVTNPTDKGAESAVEFSVQEDPALYPEPPPDAVWGSDHARGAKSWTEADGKVIEEGSLTDGKDFTAAGTDWRNDHWAEAFQFVDLGRERRLTHLAYVAGDANWVWKVDVAASADGKAYTPVPGLQGVDLHQKWGRQEMNVGEPFAARFLRLRYHNEGKKVSVIRMPVTLSAYDGVADETWDVPAVGRVVAKGTAAVKTPGRAFALADVGDEMPLPTGAYLVAAKVKTGDRTELLLRHCLVMPEAMKGVSAASQFGVNASDVSMAASHRRLGVGWVRFENMKWPMASAGPGQFRFDGSVGPWHVPHDEIMAAYRAEGLSVLPFLFQTAAYASSAPANVPEGRTWAYPPKDNATFAEFCFQTAARYGSAKHPADALKTPDKASGKGQLAVYEIWNEPNLNAKEWGPWVAPIDQYLDLFRPAAEAVKRADPKALVTNGGFAGIEVETVDRLWTYRYADGKRPLDFVDVLNVHYYSGRTPPETATIDTNVKRDPGVKEKPQALTYEEHLRRLSAWRDEHKPAMPIWLTETGYDTGGPAGVSEQLQAARLPRCIMMALAGGAEKVFVFREKGSTPSFHAAEGLARDDGSLKPSWFTYATLIRQLDGVKAGRRLPHPDANARLYLWTRPDGTAVLTAWAVDGPATLGVDLGKCVVTDSFGARREVELGKGTPVTMFPIYMTDVAGGSGVKRLAEAGAR